VGTALVLVACSSGDADSSQSSAASAGPAATISATPKARVSTVVSRGNNAVGLASGPNGRVIYAEKDSGRIISLNGRKRSTLGRVGVADPGPGGEAGLLGLASRGTRVWAYYIGPRENCADPAGTSGGAIAAHCIWRLKLSGGKLTPDKLVFSAPHPSTAENHVGGGLRFGPDRALYLGLGDLGENYDSTLGPARAQDLSVPFGKILRLDPNQTDKGAAGNPTTCGNGDNSAQRKIVDGRIWACGLRNPFSFDWDSNKRMWIAEVGDGCDELNVGHAGVNYGWQPPREDSDCAGSGKGRPVLKMTDTPTPSGVAIPKSKSALAWRNQVFFGIFADQSLARYNPKTRGQARVRAANGRTGWSLLARGNAIWMSNGQKISKLTLSRR
jgi:glucose/arabinose dehydrogenase